MLRIPLAHLQPPSAQKKKKRTGQVETCGCAIFPLGQTGALLLKIRLLWYTEMKVTKPGVSCAVRYER